MVWRPRQPPQNIEPTTGRFLREQFSDLADEVNYGGRGFLWLQPITTDRDLPPKREEGMLIYVAAGVLPGLQKGLHVWDGTQWLKV